MGLPFSDAGLNRVVGNGSGSSWDGVSYDHCAQEMKVLDRWRSVVSERSFQGIFRGRDDVRQLSGQIFGGITGADSLFCMPSRSLRLYKPVRGILAGQISDTVH
jgi:hypothetical protein